MYYMSDMLMVRNHTFLRISGEVCHAFSAITSKGSQLKKKSKTVKDAKEGVILSFYINLIAVC